jgi:hypothetical protein
MGPMSVQAIRHLMNLLSQDPDQFTADSFYEVILNAKVHVPIEGDGPSWVSGPGGQRALPVFLDRQTLLAWGGPAADERLFSMPQAAAMAAHVKDAWLAVDFGSPLNQPIARAGVEALANKSYPGAERYAEQWALVNHLVAVLRQGRRLDQALRERAQQLKFYTLGEVSGATNPSPGQVRVFESQSLSILSVRGPNQQSYLPAWPSPGGSFEYQPTATNRLVVPLATIIRGALSLERGLVLGLPSPYANIPFPQLAALWGED